MPNGNSKADLQDQIDQAIDVLDDVRAGNRRAKTWRPRSSARSTFCAANPTAATTLTTRTESTLPTLAEPTRSPFTHMKLLGFWLSLVREKSPLSRQAGITSIWIANHIIETHFEHIFRRFVSGVRSLGACVDSNDTGDL
jgi:hypothetical protein